MYNIFYYNFKSNFWYYNGKFFSYTCGVKNFVKTVNYI